MFNIVVSALQLVAFPLFMVVCSISTIVLTISLVRYLKAQRRLSNTRNKYLEIEGEFSKLLSLHGISPDDLEKEEVQGKSGEGKHKDIAEA